MSFQLSKLITDNLSRIHSILGFFSRSVPGWVYQYPQIKTIAPCNQYFNESRSVLNYNGDFDNYLSLFASVWHYSYYSLFAIHDYLLFGFFRHPWPLAFATACIELIPITFEQTVFHILNYTKEINVYNYCFLLFMALGFGVNLNWKQPIDCTKSKMNIKNITTTKLYSLLLIFLNKCLVVCSTPRSFG